MSIWSMAYVLAATVCEKEWDARISRDNKAWAKTVPIAQDLDAWGRNRNTDFVVDQAHSGLVDLFVRAARKEMTQENLRLAACLCGHSRQQNRRSRRDRRPQKQRRRTLSDEQTD